MGEKTNTDLGLGARAWEASKIYFGSNTVNHLAASVDTESIETLGNFVKKKGVETRGIDPDTKADDLLLKYTVSRITPERHLDEVDNATEIYLITDEHGHDIGTYEITENGPIFHLSPKIREYNEKIIATFPEAEQEILRGKYKADNLEELTAKLAKGESIALVSKEQARDDIEKEYETRGLSTPDGTTNQDPEEEKAINEIPADTRGEVIEKCREKGISIKAVIIVDCPDTLIDEIDNDRVGIKRGNGPVILIQARSGDASLKEDVYAFQKGVEIPNANIEKEKLSRLMDQNKGKPAVLHLVDREKEELEQKILECMERESSKIEQLGNAEFASPEDRQAAIEKIKADTAGEISSLVDYYDYEDDKEMETVVERAEERIDDKGEALEEDDNILNRWDSANPYNHD